jgi:hypothetical protein
VFQREGTHFTDFLVKREPDAGGKLLDGISPDAFHALVLQVEY